jgi:hypothetical protein
MPLCVRRATALAYPISLGASRKAGVRSGERGVIGAITLEHDLRMATPAY